MIRALGVLVVAALLVGCSPEVAPTVPSALPPSPALPAGVRLAVTGTGSFRCDGGFHGCVAWFVVRPAEWSPPEGWDPGLTDGRLDATGDMDGGWIVAGAMEGGPAALAAGSYRFVLAYSEVDDTTPLVLGTDERPGTGLMSTWVACDRLVSVPESAREVAVVATYGPDCAVEVSIAGVP